MPAPFAIGFYSRANKKKEKEKKNQFRKNPIPSRQPSLPLAAY